jgi:hypothetical protein
MNLAKALTRDITGTTYQDCSEHGPISLLSEFDFRD